MLVAGQVARDAAIDDTTSQSLALIGQLPGASIFLATRALGRFGCRSS